MCVRERETERKRERVRGREGESEEERKIIYEGIYKIYSVYHHDKTYATI
jgi:hypothetical protein